MTVQYHDDLTIKQLEAMTITTGVVARIEAAIIGRLSGRMSVEQRQFTKQTNKKIQITSEATRCIMSTLPDTMPSHLIVRAKREKPEVVRIGLSR